ncbi:glycosyltransferase family 2 protein [Ornithinimicrobium cavernae]|uniref:glycosyltransferase family 2 protein n=1 Tax=Ornithinimicrobium cavernae TaxID=2666047 RepID=UPI001F473254|nr:glycosyltransferase family A protein [Ornithinimicrobium cavernae]
MSNISGAGVPDPGASTAEGDWLPTVSVIVATRDRPALLRRAIRSFQQQTYSNITEVIVVFDRSAVEPLDDIAAEGDLALRGIPNTRTPGLAGARNSGILQASGELIAFCDDDDEWVPSKLQRQVDLWKEQPGAVGVGTGMVLKTHDGVRTRYAPPALDFDDFLRSRTFSIPSSGFLLRRDEFSHGVGLVDEALPGSYGEDWDLLLRLTRNGQFINVTDPVVNVYWDRPSFFTSKWQGLIDGLTYLIQKYPEFEREPRGLARMASQVAFAHAAMGERQHALAWARAALRRDARQPRAWAALAVASGLAPAETLVRLANSRGRGL